VSLEYFECGGLIVGGKFKLTARDRQLFEQAASQFADGYVVFRMERARRKRTDAQNKFWHGVVIPLFAEHCGEHVEEMKRTLALELIPVETRKLDGTVIITPGHTSDLDVAQFNDLIKRAQELGASMDIYIPDPNEVPA
jgi:hypothetical protein